MNGHRKRRVSSFLIFLYAYQFGRNLKLNIKNKDNLSLDKPKYQKGDCMKWFLIRLSWFLTSVVIAGCGSDKLEEALDQEEMTDIRGRLESAGIKIEWANLGPGTVAKTERDPSSGNVTSVQVNSALKELPVEVIKQHIAHEESHTQTGPGNSFAEERNSRIQEADIWRLVKGALRNVNCDANEDLIYRPNGSRRSDAEILRRLRNEYGYAF